MHSKKIDDFGSASVPRIGMPVAHVSAAKKAQLLEVLGGLHHSVWLPKPPDVPAHTRWVSVPKITDSPMTEADPHTNAILILGPHDTAETAKKAYFEHYSGGIIGITTYSKIVDLPAYGAGAATGAVDTIGRPVEPGKISIISEPWRG
jgi:hypothetical protein